MASCVARYNCNGTMVTDEERLMEERLIKIEQQSTKVHLECKHNAGGIAAEAVKYAARCSEISSACEGLATTATAALGEPKDEDSSSSASSSGMLTYRESSNCIEHMHKLGLNLIALGTEMAAASVAHKEKFVANYLEYIAVRDEWIGVLSALHTVSDRADEFYVKEPVSRLEERARKPHEEEKQK